jgi:hypothetical protein
MIIVFVHFSLISTSDMTPLEAVSRFIPSITWLQHLLPDRLKSALNIAMTSLHSGKQLGTPSYQFLSSTPFANNSQSREFRFQPSHSLLSTLPEISISFPSVDKTKCFVAAQLNLLPPQSQVLDRMLIDHTIGQHICLLGPKVLFQISVVIFRRVVENLLSPENSPK